MLADSTKREKIGTLNLDKKILSVENVIEYIKLNIQDFVDKYSNRITEDELTEHLLILLNQTPSENKPFYFHHQKIQKRSKGNTPKVDISLFSGNKETIIFNAQSYANDEPFFVIEAKRLDSKIDKRREKEYVVGRFEQQKYKNTGGIERFKKEIHGNKL